MSTDPQTPTLEPGTLINKDGNYALQHEDVYALLKYVWSSVLLPTTEEKFKERLNVKGDFEKELQPGITQLITHYKTIQSHNQIFKDVTYPSIVALAKQVKSYASDVGGDPDTSYYALLLQSCIDLNAALKAPNPDEGKIADLKDTIKGIISNQKQSIEELRVAANTATGKLRDYEGQTKQDQSDLKDTKAALDSILTGPGGEIKTLEADIQAKQQELADDQKEYEHDVVVACTALTYVWIVPFGTIAAAIVMGIYGDKAVKMKKTMEAIRGLMSDEEGKVAVDKHLVADLAMIERDLDGVLNLIGPAITAIEKMMGAWDAIEGDLQSIEDFVDKREAVGTDAILKINQKIVIRKWNELATAVDKYQQAAYITQVEEQQLDEWVKQLPEDLQKK